MFIRVLKAFVFYPGLTLLVEERVILELKAVKALDETQTAQALNYLRATGLPVCLLINFGRPRIEIKRLIPSSTWKSQKS